MDRATDFRHIPSKGYTQSLLETRLKAAHATLTGRFPLFCLDTPSTLCRKAA